MIQTERNAKQHLRKELELECTVNGKIQHKRFKLPRHNKMCCNTQTYKQKLSYEKSHNNLYFYSFEVWFKNAI